MIDKVAIVSSNYFKQDCDFDTTLRQAYERGFRRAHEKEHTVRQRIETENATLREFIEEYLCVEKCEACAYYRRGCPKEDRL